MHGDSGDLDGKYFHGDSEDLVGKRFHWDSRDLVGKHLHDDCCTVRLAVDTLVETD